MNCIELTVEGIASVIKKLKVSTSSGIDGINTKILELTIIPCSLILHHIFNQSLSTGTLPHDWKIGKVIPIFKSGNKSDVSNHRPTSIPCKILEHIIASNIAQHLENNLYFFPQQHSFTKGLSCETQLLEFTHDLHSNMDGSSQTDCIYVDFSKAFDRVAHCHLITKLSSLNLDSLTISWL